MDDGISFTFDTSEFDAMTVDIKDPTRKATMYALRATGRYIARVAKSKAPVYSGTDPRAMAERGNLKKSIANARRMTASMDTFELKVGPFGTAKKGTAVVRSKARSAGGTSGEVRGVPLYRNQMEARYGFMASAIAAGNTDATKVIFDAAYAKAWEKFSA